MVLRTIFALAGAAMGWYVGWELTLPVSIPNTMRGVEEHHAIVALTILVGIVGWMTSFLFFPKRKYE